MTREWKPGDVAIYQYIGQRTGTVGDPQTALRVSRCRAPSHTKGAHWHLSNGGWTQFNEHIRPFVTIDPENREDIERLALCYVRTFAVDPISPTTVRICADQMQAALREYAAPPAPKPDEPTGWLAAVVDAEGNRYYRVSAAPAPGSAAWAREGQDYVGAVLMWASVPAVRVLSEGHG